MNLHAHYDSYRGSLSRDALAGYAEVASTLPTKKPHEYKTVYDYLRAVKTHIEYALASDNEERYCHWLGQHQAVVLKLFRHMVADYVHDRPMSKELLVEIIANKGWNWFKFCNASLEFELEIAGDQCQVLLVPRYSPEFLTDLRDHAVFDANEYAELKLASDEVAGARLRFKRRGPDLFKCIGEMNYQLQFINDQVVRDWSLPLTGCA